MRHARFIWYGSDALEAPWPAAGAKTRGGRKEALPPKNGRCVHFSSMPASSHREIELLFLVHTYICSRVGVTNDATLVSQINSHLSGPSSEPLDKEIERRKSSASEIAHQRETLGRRRLESSSTEYENVHIFHYTLIRVLPPMDW